MIKLNPGWLWGVFKLFGYLGCGLIKIIRLRALEFVLRGVPVFGFFVLVFIF